MHNQIIPISQIKSNTGQIEGLPKNPRIIKDAKYKKLLQSIKENPEMLDLRELLVFPLNGEFVAIAGNMRLKACTELKYTELNCKVLDVDTTVDNLKAYTIKDNVSFGEHDWSLLDTQWESHKLDNWGVDVPDLIKEKKTKIKEAHDKLSDKFIVPPFSILDSRQGYWQDRKKHWRELINDNAESREGLMDASCIMSDTNNGSSLLDPVLSELVNKWFGVPKGKTFDCFAGDAVFGYVSSYLGHEFTGIELRQEQVDLNNERVNEFPSKYICDDGRNVLKHIKKESQDLLFSCPPYYNLEVYSNLANDASNQKDYSDFIAILDTAFTNAVKCLKNNRFAVITVGDLRDENGFFYGFVDDVKAIFKRNGLLLYNDMILAERLGTLPQRVARYMVNRKVGKCHQNVLVFYKGDPKEISKIYPKIEIKPEITI